MTTTLLLLKAVQNRIDRCNAVAKAHQLRTHILGGLWYCEDPMPTGFPNIITMQKGAFNSATINDLLGSLPKPWIVKDCFDEYKEHPNSYQFLFDASWFYSEPLTNTAGVELFQTLNVAQTADELDAWCAEADQTGKFPEVMLHTGPMMFVYLGTASAMQCGASLCLSQEVVGIANLFGSTEDQQRLIRTIQMSYPSKPIVGYGTDAELTVLKPFGFRTMGSLSVLLNMK